MLACSLSTTMTTSTAKQYMGWTGGRRAGRRGARDESSSRTPQLQQQHQPAHCSRFWHLLTVQQPLHQVLH
jgi:hypothetical protein